MSSRWIKFAFVISALWWVYLFFTTKFVVVYDAGDYEILGKMIAYHGWPGFFRMGVEREPMFPGLVALSMRLGDWWGCYYGYPLKMIGILYLFLTMIFSYRLMRLLWVRPFIAALAVLYIGISPVMTNSSLRLWSEFAAYPWVVLTVIWTIKSWKLLDNLSQDRHGYFRITQYAGMVALMFLLIMLVKAVAEGVLILYLWPFYWRMISNWRSRNFIKSKQAAVFCLTVFLVFEGVVCGYKWCNYHYNGNFAFTTRGIPLVYGNAVRRTQPLTLERLGAALAYVPGMGVCTSIFSRKDCDFWSGPDWIWIQKIGELAKQGITGHAASNYFIINSGKMVFAHPLQVLLLMAIEAQKMFFWESSLDFVTYPDWLDRVLNSVGFSYSLRIIFAILSWIACVFAFCIVCFRRQRIDIKDKAQKQALFWTVNFIFWYIWMFSWVHIFDRFSFPLISLFMALISFLADRLVSLVIPVSCSPSQNFGKSADSPRSLQNRNIFLCWKQYPGWTLIFMLAITQLGWFGLAPGNFKAIWRKNPLVAHMIKENVLVERKSKFVILSFWAPNFEYLAKTVSGNLPPNIVMGAGYPDYYRKAVDLFPDVDAIHYLLGFCEYHQGHLDIARVQYERSVELNPNFFWSYYNLGVIYFKQGEWLKSALILNKALSLRKAMTLVDLNQNPFYWQTWHHLDNPGQILENNLTQGLEDAALLLAAIGIKEGQYDQALQIVQSVGQANPWHQALWRQLHQKALNKQPLPHELDISLQEQVQVRLF